LGEPDDTTAAARREKERAYRDYVNNLTTVWQRGRLILRVRLRSRVTPSVGGTADEGLCALTKGGPLMDLSQAPAFVAVNGRCSLTLARPLRQRADELTAQISDRHDRWSGRIARASDHPEKLRIELERLLAEQKSLQARRPIDMGSIQSCKAWLDRFPTGTKLEPVAVTADGMILLASAIASRPPTARSTRSSTLQRRPATSRRACQITCEGSRRRCWASASASDSVSSGPVPSRRPGTSPSIPVIHWRCWPRCFPTECSPSLWARLSAWRMMWWTGAPGDRRKVDGASPLR
jgi:hypothetical protein